MTLSINGHEVIPGAEWVTRGGDIATIAGFDLNACQLHVVVGWINGKSKEWGADGRYYANADSYEDLIRPVAAPAEKKVEKPTEIQPFTPGFLKPGATVHFRNGGSAVVGLVKIYEQERWPITIHLKEYGEDCLSYQIDGSKRDRGTPDLLDILCITPAPEKRKVQIAEFWTLHKKDGSITGSSVVGFNRDWINKDDVVIHHPAREIEVDDV